VHRDLKAGNVFLTRQGEVKLLDFGLARSAGDASMTATGVGMGTPNYWPPELVAQGGELNNPSDIFAAAILLYELLNMGIKPRNFSPPGRDFTQASLAYLDWAKSDEAVFPKLEELLVPPSVKQLISAMGDRDPSRRPTAEAAEAQAVEILREILVRTER
jgi:serine/threonine-protein kinase